MRAVYQDERTLIVDCLTLLVSNVLLEEEDAASVTARRAVNEEIDSLLGVLRDLDTTAILVSNEVGMGLVWSR